MHEGTDRLRDCRVIPPLAGHTVALTGERRSHELAVHLEACGATTMVGPVLQARADGDVLGRLWAATAAIIACPPDYLVATTATGMRSWLDGAAAWGLREDLVAALGSTRVLARGPKVEGALHAAGLAVWFADRSGRLDGLLDALAAQGVRGARVAVQVPGQDGEAVMARVAELGANVVAVDAYELGRPDDLGPARRLVRAVAERRVSAVTFTSRAAARTFVDLARVEQLGEPVMAALAGDVVPFCVGPVAAGGLAEAEATGVAAVWPAQPTLGAMVDALSSELRRRHHRHLRTADGVEVVVQGRSVAGPSSMVLMSDREGALLRQLVESAGRVVSTDVLLRRVWTGEDVEPAVIETTMARLRRRLRGTGITVETRRRRGYLLPVDVVNCGQLIASGPANLSAPAVA
jgi:uroporphyrinogen-III synthase